jgi:hypothetical protein
MRYDGINPQRITSQPVFDNNAFSRVNARDTASKLESVIAGIEETTEIDARDIDVRAYQDSIAAHEHGDKRIYAAIQPSTTTNPPIQKTSRTTTPIRLEAETHAYVVAQPQLGSAYDWDSDTKYETETNKQRVFDHVDDMVHEWLDDDYVDAATSPVPRTGQPSLSINQGILDGDDLSIEAKDSYQSLRDSSRPNSE